MDATIIKALSEAGLGLGSLVIMAVLFIYQLKTNSKMFDKFGENLDKNTEATTEMTKTLISMNETNRAMVDNVTYCRAKTLSKNYK